MATTQRCRDKRIATSAFAALYEYQPHDRANDNPELPAQMIRLFMDKSPEALLELHDSESRGYAAAPEEAAH